jgi:hypothetical protein
MRSVSSEELPQISRTLPVNIGYFESTSHTQSEMQSEYQLPTLCTEKQGSELMEHTHIVQEFPQVSGTESDSSVQIETLNINFPKDIPLSCARNVACKHRTSVHVQSEFDLTQLFPEIVPVQCTKPSHLPVEKTLCVNVSEVDSLPLETSVKTPELLMKPRITNTVAVQMNGGLMLNTDLLSHKHAGLTSSHIANGNESLSNIINPEEITVECKSLQTASSNCTHTADSKGGYQVENGVEVISEVSMQENPLQRTENFKFHSELKNEIQAAPDQETHVNTFTMLPHEETMIELLPRKKTGKLSIKNEIGARVEQGADSKKFEGSKTIAETDLISNIPKFSSPDKMGKTRVASPTSPFSVKQRSTTDHSSKLEDNGDSLYDYKWTVNRPGEPVFIAIEDIMMPVPSEQLETTISGDGKRSLVWPIDSVHVSHNPEEGEYLESPTNCFADDIFKPPCAQNDKNAIRMLVHERDFDDGIEVNDCVEDSSRYSLQEIAESIGQLVSDVEMDEAQLMKHLSCFQNPVVKSSDAHENNDAVSEHLESDIISNIAVTQYEKGQKQEHFENSRPVRAEVKLLVKTCDTGKEAIEIRSMKEYLDIEVAYGQEDSSSLHVTDLKASTYMLENFQEQLDLPQNFESSAKSIPLKLMQSSSEFTNDECVLHPYEVLENDSFKLKVFENIQLGSDFSKKVVPMPSTDNIEQGHTSLTSERWQEHNLKFFHLSHDGKMLDDTAIQKLKTPKQGEQEKMQLQRIQRLFIRSPNLTLSEPLNMLPSEGSMRQQSSAAKIKPHEIKKLLIRSQNYEDFITFPIVTSSSSLPSDLKPLSIIPTPPPQHLPKTKLFENLPTVPLSSDEDLMSPSHLSQNISLKNIFFSFLPIDDISDIPGSSNSCTYFARWWSLPSVAVRTGSSSSSNIPLSGATFSYPLTRAVSMPCLQHPVCPVATEVHATHVSSSHSSDAEPKDWGSLHGDEDESSLIMQSSSDPNQTNLLSSAPVSLSSRSGILSVFGQPNFSLPRLSGSSRRNLMSKLSSSPSSSLSSLHTERIIPHMSSDLYRFDGRKSLNAFNSMSLNNYQSLIETSPRPARSPRQCRCNQKSDMDTLTCPQTTPANTQSKLDPWYLQTEFLLSPVVIPSGYCAWVQTPDQQTYSRGKEGVDF